MQTIAELKSFRRAAQDAGMSDQEIGRLVDFLAWTPAAAVEIPGTGGCRKLRVAGRGKGKSGGFRTITFYSGVDLPVFLITVFGKGEKDNLTAAERNQLLELTKILVSEYRKKCVAVGAAGGKE